MKKIFFCLFIVMFFTAGCGKNKRDEIIFYAPLETEHVATDENTGLSFVDNQLIITFNDKVSQKKILKFVKSINAQLVGSIDCINKVQVRLDGINTLDELNTKIAEIEQDPLVARANINQVLDNIEPDMADPVSDPVYTGEWNDEGRVDGKNWHLEAIRAQGAWQYASKMKNINVGVLEAAQFCQFKTDVKFKEPVFNNNESVNEFHGLAVAGTIAAERNSTGICGVMPNATIYGASIHIDEEGYEEGYPEDQYYVPYFGAYQQEVMFAYLICRKHCKVINCSYSDYQVVCFAASRGNRDARNRLEAINDELGDFFSLLLDKGYDFLIVKSAGNNENIEFVKNDGAQFGYVLYEESDDFWDNLELLYNVYIEHSIVSGDVDPKYSPISGIEDERVQEHIIVVGAAAHDSSSDAKYKMASFSSGGDDFTANGGRVDLTAPGEHVLIYGNINNKKVKDKGIEATVAGDIGVYYGDGTSISAPIVAGVAGMIYGINPRLTAPEVKAILCDDANVYTDVRMIDAEKCVMAALNAGKKTVTNNDSSNYISPERQEKLENIISDYEETPIDYSEYINRWEYDDAIWPQGLSRVVDFTYLPPISYIEIESVDENQITGKVCAFDYNTDMNGDVCSFHGVAMDHDTTPSVLYTHRGYRITDDTNHLFATYDQPVLYLTRDRVVMGGGGCEAAWHYFKRADMGGRVLIPGYINCMKGRYQKDGTTQEFAVIETNAFIEEASAVTVPVDAIFYSICEVYGCSAPQISNSGDEHIIHISDMPGYGDFELHINISTGKMYTNKDELETREGAVRLVNGRIDVDVETLRPVFGWFNSAKDIYSAATASFDSYIAYDREFEAGSWDDGFGTKINPNLVNKISDETIVFAIPIFNDVNSGTGDNEDLSAYIGTWEYYTAADSGNYGGLYNIHTVEINSIDDDHIEGVCYTSEPEGDEYIENKPYPFSTTIDVNERGKKYFLASDNYGDAKIELTAPDLIMQYYDEFYDVNGVAHDGIIGHTYFTKKNTNFDLSKLTALDEICESNGQKWRIVSTDAVFYGSYNAKLVPIDDIISSFSDPDGFGINDYEDKGQWNSTVKKHFISIEPSVLSFNTAGRYLEMELTPSWWAEQSEQKIWGLTNAGSYTSYQGNVWPIDFYNDDYSAVEDTVWLVDDDMLAKILCGTEQGTIYPDAYPDGIETGKANMVGSKIVFAIPQN